MDYTCANQYYFHRKGQKYMTNSSLLEVSDSMLIVIDVQPSFVKKESKNEHNPLLQRICWVIQVANWLGVQLIVTVQDIPRTGSVTKEVAGLLDLGYRVVVVADATGSPGNGHLIGLERIRHADGIIVSAKSLYYE